MPSTDLWSVAAVHVGTLSSSPSKDERQIAVAMSSTWVVDPPRVVGATESVSAVASPSVTTGQGTHSVPVNRSFSMRIVPGPDGKSKSTVQKPDRPADRRRTTGSPPGLI